MTQYRFVYEPTTTVVSDFLDLQLQAGKQFVLDALSASTGQARFRRTTSNSATIDAITPGDYVYIEWTNASTWSTLFYARVTDVSVEWGNPTEAGVYNSDYATVTFEGCLGAWGRCNVSATVAQAKASDQIDQMNTLVGTALVENFSSYNDPVLASYTVNGAAQDYLQILQGTTNCRYVDYQADTLDVRSAYNFPTSTYNFTDSTATSTLMTYQRSTWDSLSVNYYDQILCNWGPDSGNAYPAVATASGASQPYRVLQQSTIWNTLGETLGYAQYLLDLYKAPALQLSSITCLTEAQSSQRLASMAFTCIGKKFSIVHRGTTYYGICEGWEMTATPGNSTFTYYFSDPAQDVAWFILDDATQGVLDVNKLGF